MSSPIRRQLPWIRRLKPVLFEFLSSPAFVALLVIVYSSAFSLYSTARYLGLQTGAWDTGTYNQALYTALFSGKLFYYTADLPANPTGSLFGIHFSPILMALAPFYWVFPGPVTLLVAQAVALGLGALPVYYLARDRLKERMAASTLALAYLVSPLTVGINWFNFHPEAFLPASVLGTILFWNRAKWGRYFVCLIAGLATIETAPVIVGALAMYFAWQEKTAIRSIHSLKELRRPRVIIPLASIVLSGAWLLLALGAIRILNPINVFYYGGSPLYWTILGAKNLGQVPLRVIVDPASAFTALLYDVHLKVLYLFALFAPLLFLPVRSRGYVILTIPWIGVAFVSNYAGFYLVGFQYVAFVLPFIFAGAVEGFRRMEASGRPSWFKPATARKWLPVASVVCLTVLSPLVPWLTGASQPAPPYGVFSPGSHEADVRQIVSLIPSNASVLTQPNIFPLVSSRVDAFTVPTVSLFPPGTSFNATFTQWLNQSDYVLLDPTTDQVSALLTLPRLEMMHVHRLFVQFDYILLFKKFYSGNPTVIHPAQAIFDWTNLRSANGVSTTDSKSSSGRALVHQRSTSSQFWNSSEVWLPAGSYTATFRLKADQEWNGSLLRIRMVRYLDSIISTPLGTNQTGYNYQFTTHMTLETSLYFWLTSTNFTADAYQSLVIQFVANGTESFAFSGDALADMTDIYLDNIIIQQNTP